MVRTEMQVLVSVCLLSVDQQLHMLIKVLVYGW